MAETAPLGAPPQSEAAQYAARVKRTIEGDRGNLDAAEYEAYQKLAAKFASGGSLTTEEAAAYEKLVAKLKASGAVPSTRRDSLPSTAETSTRTAPVDTASIAPPSPAYAPPAPAEPAPPPPAKKKKRKKGCLKNIGGIFQKAVGMVGKGASAFSKVMDAFKSASKVGSSIKSIAEATKVKAPEKSTIGLNEPRPDF